MSWVNNSVNNSGTYINSLRIDQTPAAGTYGTLAGTVNGSNALFTVSNGAYASGTLMVFLNGQEQTQGSSNDWVETTPASGTFTFNTAPPTSSIIQAVYVTQGTSIATGNTPTILATVNSISGTAVASTALYTVPAGKTCVVTSAIIKCTAATSITNGPTAGIGNTTSTNTIFASSAMTALTAASTIFGFNLTGISVYTAAASVIYLNISTGSTGTSQSLSCDLIGYIY